ncbi:MAG TPA: type IV toxin-antitoxin system AbiEi family antitoxin domain-containing protein [Acidimicrobiales bacterium]|nr:type IV toxin-antitoxin system AbiEi family antitoxin domain-containing protein [Acidimicrobiales bacterium]
MPKEVEMDWEAESRLLAIAAMQLGLFTVTQALDAGVSRRTLRTRIGQGAWRRFRRGVFVVEGHPSTPAQAHMAAVLATGVDGTRSSHRAGAWLWAMTPYEQTPEVTIPADVRLRWRDVRVHRTQTPLLPAEVRKGVPVTTAAETLLDLGAVMSLQKVQLALDRGIANRVVTPMSALAELERRGKMGVRGTAALRHLLDDAGITGSHPPSVLEAKMRRLIDKAGLPQPRCELIVGEHGEYRLDFSWPDLLLAVEVEGWLYHSSLAAFQANKTRRNRLSVAGYLIVEYTWAHVTRTPAGVVAELKKAYAGRVRAYADGLSARR